MALKSTVLSALVGFEARKLVPILMCDGLGAAPPTLRWGDDDTCLLLVTATRAADGVNAEVSNDDKSSLPTHSNRKLAFIVSLLMMMMCWFVSDVWFQPRFRVRVVHARVASQPIGGTTERFSLRVSIAFPTVENNRVQLQTLSKYVFNYMYLIWNKRDSVVFGCSR